MPREDLKILQLHFQHFYEAIIRVSRGFFFFWFLCEERDKAKYKNRRRKWKRLVIIRLGRWHVLQA